MIIFVLSVLAFAFSLIGAIAQGIVEKRWPSEMMKFVFWFGAAIACFLFLGYS